ncbi:MAG TPA: hydrolase [Tepidisphaeraceae bacterium]|jgi:glutamate carboxypeptidase
MSKHQPALDWIATQQKQLLRRTTDWAMINTYSFNTVGMAKLTDILANEFSPLGGDILRHDLPPAESIDSRGQKIRTPLGQALSIIKRPQAPLRILLNIHTDTVYPPNNSPQPVTEIDGKLKGPGVADAKGGIAIMLTALEAFERFGLTDQLGWQVVLNPDEEIGSPGSISLLASVAKTNHLGLLFEPALADGALVDQRRGSGIFAIIIRGRSAHAGRDFANGRNAVVAAAQLTTRINVLNQSNPGVTLNISAIDGGSPANVVPDLAICRLNIRTTELADEQRILSSIQKLVNEINSLDGISAELTGRFTSPPKILDDRTNQLLQAIISCGQDLGLSLTHRPSGGVSDGNKLAAAGLPNIDTLGVRGDRIHSPDEFLFTDSLVERAQLVALLLLKLAAGDIDPKPFCR